MVPLMEPLASPIERRARREPRQRAATLLVLLAVWLAGGLLLLAVGLQHRVPVRDLMVDPVTVEGADWYAGMVTSVGVLGWSVAVCGSVVTAYTTALAGRASAAAAFRGTAQLCGLLLLDDLFLLHSNVLPGLLGTSKVVVLACYGMLAVLWASSSLPELRRTRWELLVASGAAFALSLGVDLGVHGPEAGGRLLVEDGAKLLGVLALAAWSVTTARDVIRSVVVTTEPAAPTGEPDQRLLVPLGAGR